jgi:Xaa-Pro aminopeptidase
MATASHLRTATERLAALRAACKREQLDGYIITDVHALRYLFGYSGSTAAAIVTKKKVHFFTNDLYAVQVQKELYKVDGLTIHIDRNFWGAAAAAGVPKQAAKLGFDASRTLMAQHAAMKKFLAPSKLVDASGLVDAITMVKAPYEIKEIARAAQIVSTAYERMLGVVEAGHTERDVANYLATVTRELGSEKDAFDIIVVAGARSAMPHGRASTNVIKKGDVVTVDFGACVNGFYSDMTRTFCVGQPSKKVVDVFAVLYDAHMSALDAARTGVTGAELDAAARDIITKAGYGEMFKHSLGHGLGYEVHEMPRVSYVNTKQTLPTNCVVTIEPGIYLPGKFGMRIEDDVVIKPEGPEILTSAPIELVVV